MKRQREIVQEKLKEKGIVPSISDLEACQRVGRYGLDLFNDLMDLLVGELNKRLQDNRALKEKLEQLRGTKEELETANIQVAKQKKLLERLPQAEKEGEEARPRETEAEASQEGLKTRVAELTKADSEHRKRLAKVSVKGFHIALDIIAILAIGINFNFFNSNYVAREGKLYEGDRVSYDPVVDVVFYAGEEEETKAKPNTDAAEPWGDETGAS